jgi:hypothetical protein
MKLNATAWRPMMKSRPAFGSFRTEDRTSDRRLRN